MKKLSVLSLLVLFCIGASTLTLALAVGASTKSEREPLDEQRAVSLSRDQIDKGLFKGEPLTPSDVFGGATRSVSVYQSSDGAVSLGSFEIEIDAATPREHRYESFPRNELMYFTRGGMKLVDDDGHVVEAGPGEMLFIPKGWTGTRVFTGDAAMQKISIVYR